MHAKPVTSPPASGELTQCTAYGCSNKLENNQFAFCKQCREDYSLKALELMRSFGAPIRQVLVEATKLFVDAQGIADYLGVSLPTLYSWINRFHNMSFRQFRRKYICSGRTCIVVDHGSTDYAWKYTISDRIHTRKGCMCFVEGSDRLMMTTLSAESVAEALHSEVALERSTDIHHIRYPVRLPIFNPNGPKPSNPYSWRTKRKTDEEE
jgi:hypothetical protein